MKITKLRNSQTIHNCKSCWWNVGTEALCQERQCSYLSTFTSVQEGYKADVTLDLADRLCTTLTSLPGLAGEVVLDDRLKLSIGRRLTQAKQMGFPHTIVIGKKVHTFLIDVHKGMHFCGIPAGDTDIVRYYAL